ncbi:hypothetical protein RF55_23583, partial [Lasius niger]
PGPHLRPQQTRLDLDQIGIPLVMQPRCIDGLLDVHPELGDVEDALQRGGNDGGAARTAGDEIRFALLQDDRRRHRAERPLAALNLIRLALNQTEGIGDTWLGSKVVHLIIEEKPGITCDLRGAEQVIQRIGNGHRVALRIDHRIMGGVDAFAAIQLALDLAGRRGTIGADAGTQSGDVPIR